MSKKISDKDKKDWENFLSSEEKLTNKDLKLSKKKNLKINHIDLHGFTLEQANIAIEKFINNSMKIVSRRSSLLLVKDFIQMLKKILMFQKSLVF